MKGSSYSDLRPYQCHPQWSKRKIKPRRQRIYSTKRSCEFIDKWWTAGHQGAQILFRLPQGAILLIAPLGSFGNAIYHSTVPLAWREASGRSGSQRLACGIHQRPSLSFNQNIRVDNYSQAKHCCAIIDRGTKIFEKETLSLISRISCRNDS